MNKVAYYKGCLASLSAKELDISTQALAPKLGLELVELESVTCCGAGDIHEAEPDYYLHLNARILANAEATGTDTLMTICNVCTLNLRQANWQLTNDEALRARVNENLEGRRRRRPYSGEVEVKHLLWLIAEGEGYELLKGVAHKGLKGLKVAPFYGCQILRPSKLLGFEDPDRPSSLERIIEACGGEPIDYPAKIKCCGFPIIQAREEVALNELIQPIEQAIEAGADAMVTPCPLCHLSLDAWQSKLEKATGRDARHADPPPVAADRRRGRLRGLEAEVQAPRRTGDPRHREARRLNPLWIAVVVGAIAAAGLAWGWFEAGWVRLRTLDVEVPGLPAELDRRADRPSLRLSPGPAVARDAGGGASRGVDEGARPRARVRHRRPRVAAARRGEAPRVRVGAAALLCHPRQPRSRASAAIRSRRRSSCAPWSRRRSCSTRAGWSTCAGGTCGSPGLIRARGGREPRLHQDAALTILLSHFPSVLDQPGRRGRSTSCSQDTCTTGRSACRTRRQAAARASVGPLHPRLLPARRDGDARLAGPRNDVRALPLLRATGGHGAGPASRPCPFRTCLGDSPRVRH